MLVRNEPLASIVQEALEGYGKSIRRETIQAQFETLLQRLQPSESLFASAQAMFRELRDHRLASGEENRRALTTELSTIERQVEQFLDRIADAETPSVIAAYEKSICKLEERKLTITEKIANCGRPLRRFDETLS